MNIDSVTFFIFKIFGDMQKKSVIVPIIAVLVIIAGVFASSGFPDTGSLPRIPTGPGTIGGVLYNLFETDGSAKNANSLSGVSATGYLQNNNCTDPINNKWIGIDENGRWICANGWAVLAAIGKFSEISWTVEVLKFGTSVWIPANTTDDLYPGDFIRTDSSGTGTIRFAMDDSLIRLFTDTTLELQMGNLDGNSVAEAILSDGRLWWRILSSTGVNLGGWWVVTGVRGTSVDVIKVGTLYTISVTDSVNPVNVLKKQDGSIISSVKDGSTSIPNLDFWKWTRFIYENGNPYDIKKFSVDKNIFYTDAWFRKNTRLDVAYMSDLVENYGAMPVFLAKKSRLIAELDTTIELDNTGTLVQLLQDSGIASWSDIVKAANLLNEENQSGWEGTDKLNQRKTKRLNCKMEGKTYFPELNDCGGSWNTFATTDFWGSATGTLFWKNNDWHYSSVWPYNNAPTNAWEYILYTGSLANLFNKHISITVDRSDLLRPGSNYFLLSLKAAWTQWVWHNSSYIYFWTTGQNVKLFLTWMCLTSLSWLSSSTVDIVLINNTWMQLQSGGVLLPWCSAVWVADLVGRSQFMIGAKNSSSLQWVWTIHKVEIY